MSIQLQDSFASQSFTKLIISIINKHVGSYKKRSQKLTESGFEENILLKTSLQKSEIYEECKWTNFLQDDAVDVKNFIYPKIA